jgi:polar amino acid transport system substrate-binding protein
MKNKYFYSLLCVALFGVYYFFSHFFASKQDNTLIIGVMSGWSPFASINNKGMLEGFDIDIAEKIGVMTNKKIIIKDLGSLSSLFIALEQGVIDAAFSGLDITAKRKENYEVVFYGDIGKLTHICIVSNEHGPVNEDDLYHKEYRVGIESGSSLEVSLDQYSSIKKVYFTSIADMLLQLNEKRIDCFVIDPIQYYRLNNEVKSLLSFQVPLHESAIIEGIGILIKKDNMTIKNIIENAIKKMLENNDVEVFAHKWYLKN